MQLCGAVFLCSHVSRCAGSCGLKDEAKAMPKQWCKDNGQDYYSDRVRVTKSGNSSLQSSSGGVTMNLQLLAKKSGDYETVHLFADDVRLRTTILIITVSLRKTD